MKVSKIVETCIYSPDLASMKKFYVGILGLQLVQEEENKFIFLKAGKSMLLFFNPDRTMKSNDGLPAHGAATPPSSVHFAMQIELQDYQRWKELLANNNIKTDEVGWKSARSIYFRDPAGNLVELITPGEWPVES